MMESYAHANSGLEPTESELKTAVSLATAQFGQDLHALGSELLNIEARHRALLERLQRIAEQVDERVLHHFETLREEVTGAQSQNLSLRQDLEVLRESFPQQLEMLGSQCASLNQQFHTAEQRLEGIEQQLRDAVQRIHTAEARHDAVEERLPPAEQKILQAEQNWQRSEAQFQIAGQRFAEIEQQIYAADGRIQTAENNHNAMQEQLQAAEQRIATAESNHSTMQQLLQAAEQRIAAAETRHEAMAQMLQAAEQKISETEQKLVDADRDSKTFTAQMKTRAERLTAQCDEIKRSFEGQTTQRETIEGSIGALGKDLGQLKEQYSELLTGPYERLKSIQDSLKSYRRILLVSVVAFFLTLLMIGYMKVAGLPI
jgi:chromosome segregation protein